jgi:hypothetical protein
MAREGQDFFKWEEDSFKIQVLVEDATTDLSSYEAYWAVAETPSSTPVIVKTTDGDFSEEGGITWTSTDVLVIDVDKTDTDGLTHSAYYHELTIKNPITNESVVIAVGEFDLRRPLFPAIYR